MATKVKEESSHEFSSNVVNEAQMVSPESHRKKGGWVTFPFISGCLAGTWIAQSGIVLNFIVYLIQEFNVKSIDAAQIFNIINGCLNITPVVGAIVSDSYFGCFAVVAASTFVSFLGMIVFTLTATLRSLRPTPCSPGSDTCEPPTSAQLGILYAAVAMMSIGAGGARFNLATMGANQFDMAKDQSIFFNWFFCIVYGSSIIGATAIVYVEDNVGWSLGFGLCVLANALAFVLLILGVRYYRRPKPEGSPFTGLARVVVAAVRKRRLASTAAGTVEYHYGFQEEKSRVHPPSNSLRVFNRAAVKTEGDIGPDGAIARPWHLCTVQEVEDMKSVTMILPLWSSAIFVSVSIGIEMSLSVVQALTIDRSVTSHFSIPAGSLMVSMLATISLVLPLLDRAIYPACHLLVGRTPTPLERIGLGHVLNIAAMAAAALVERRRLGIVHAYGLGYQPGSVVPMSVLWLTIPFVLVGIGEALHFPGQVALYYQEFPASLKSLSTGMITLIVALGFYLSTAVVDLLRRVTDWLPDNINRGKMDRVYWTLAIVGAINFGFYYVCAKSYKYRGVGSY